MKPGSNVAEVLGDLVEGAATLLTRTVTDPNGKQTSYSYNSAGDLVSSTDPLGHTTSYSYNSYDQRTCVAAPMAATACSSLTPPAPVATGATTVSPPSSVPPKYVRFSQYDSAGKLLWTTAGDYLPGASSASQARTSYQLYSGQSLTLGATSHTCAASPPSSALPCLTIDPNGIDTQLGYDATSGDLTSSATEDGNAGGELAKTSFTYDGDGELTSLTKPNGNLAGASAADFTTSNGYDDDGRLTTVTVGHTGGSLTARTTSYGYDGNGN